MFLLAKYGVATSFTFPMVKRGSVDLAVTADWTPAAGDVKLGKDGGTLANVATLPTISGGAGSVLWSLSLSATELQCAVAMIQIVDQGTKTVEDNVLRIYTYGHASAKLIQDFSDPMVSGLRKNKALAHFRFSMTLAGTTTPATGKSATMSVKRGLDAAFPIAGTLGAVTEIGGGDYDVSWAAADTNGDAISFEASEASCNTTKIHMVTDK